MRHKRIFPFHITTIYATLKTVQATFTMSTNEGAKHGDEDEHIHENAHQVRKDWNFIANF